MKARISPDKGGNGTPIKRIAGAELDQVRNSPSGGIICWLIGPTKGAPSQDGIGRMMLQKSGLKKSEEVYTGSTERIYDRKKIYMKDIYLYIRSFWYERKTEKKEIFLPYWYEIRYDISLKKDRYFRKSINRFIPAGRKSNKSRKNVSWHDDMKSCIAYFGYSVLSLERRGAVRTLD